MGYNAGAMYGAELSDNHPPDAVPSESEGPGWACTYYFDGVLSDETRTLIKKHLIANSIKGAAGNKPHDRKSYVVFETRGMMGGALDAAVETMRPLIGMVISNHLVNVTLVPTVDARQPIDENPQVRIYDVTYSLKNLLGLNE